MHARARTSSARAAAEASGRRIVHLCVARRAEESCRWSQDASCRRVPPGPACAHAHARASSARAAAAASGRRIVHLCVARRAEESCRWSQDASCRRVPPGPACAHAHARASSARAAAAAARAAARAATSGRGIGRAPSERMPSEAVAFRLCSRRPRTRPPVWLDASQ